MLYVVVEELIPEMSQGQHSSVGTVFFAVGFSVMMVLDVALGVMVGDGSEIFFKISEND
jgi:ZIP family zinc transporter